MKHALLVLLVSLASLLFTVRSIFSHEKDAGILADKAKRLTAYEEIYDQLMGLTVDPQKIAAVSNLTITRDVARFVLEEGELYLLSPVQNRTIAAIFLGKGRFYFAPPTAIEQEQLQRFYEAKSLEKKFKALFLIFTDSTLAELQRNVTFTAREAGGEVKGQIKSCLDYPSAKDGKYFDIDIMKALLDGKSNGLFYAHLADKSGDPLFFRINPDDVEEISLQRRAETTRFYKVSEVVCQFHKQEDYQRGRNLANEGKDLLDVTHYTIDSKLTGTNLDFAASAEINFRPLEPEQRWLYFYLFFDMEVDSAFWDDGRPLTFFKKKNNPVLWIQCDPPLVLNQFRSFKIFYHGELIKRETDWFYIRDPDTWYPVYGTRRAKTFDLTFHTPEQFAFASVGENTLSQGEGEILTTRWITPEPIRAASFNIGLFKKHEINAPRLPPVTVLMAESGHREIGQALVQEGVLSGKNMEKQVGSDVANSLTFFQETFGKTPVKHFYATEIPYGHGQAFPGLIHLSWTTFQRTDEEGWDEIFRAHEVAHQWWGIGVDFQTYHDQWLSEALAEFSGLWYMQMVLQNNKKYFGRLKDWREAIFSNRKFLFGSGQEAGPIWLGYRTSSSKTAGDYNLIIYKKGGWVLHMLRNILLDLKTMKEEVFTNVLRDFYATYLGKKASTENFQKVVEKHVRQDMSWFFKQWVYGTEIPTYQFSYKTEKNESGKYVVRCKIEQLDVPEDFQMPVPVYIDFGNQRFARVRVPVKGPVTKIDLPLLPEKPEKIVFNDLESVLCEVKYVKWVE
jgi:hypothetical protein